MENNFKFYNTLTRKVEAVIPHEDGKISMYTCGPTVYHYAHIGNLRSYIMEDVLEKSLRYIGYDVKRVMNITDVGHLSSDADTGEDKMLKGAKREHKSVMEVAKFYTDAFFRDCAMLHIKTPDVVEPATNCIPEFIHMIEVLLEKGYAYTAGGNVYFDTSKLSEYLVFTGQNGEEMLVGAREDVEEDVNKRNKNDFVLWFTKSKFEEQALKWDSPWGVGYPGWHIECSCIGIKHLGEYMDIHCGGVDNIFPHHTNEIAQSESYLGHKWCSYWFHVNHLNDKAGKMSKSSGDFLTLSLLKERGYDPLAYRLFCLQSHYRKPLEFSFEALDNAQAAYRKLVKKIAELKPGSGAAEESAVPGAGGVGAGESAVPAAGGMAAGESAVPGAVAGGVAAEETAGLEPGSGSGKPMPGVDAACFAEYRQRFVDALSDDLNTSMAITLVYDILKEDVGDATKFALIEDFDRVLSLGLTTAEVRKPEEDRDVDEEMERYILAKIEERKAAKKAKDFAAADAIRDELAAKGIVLKDTREGVVWHKA